MLNAFRDWLAKKLGVSPERKEELYLELARSTTLTDPAYWLQTVFAAGIATLGLVLNSPAVIIGAMLISPLMGPILAGGLALASGDLILGLRAGLNLALSCLVAVGFATLLVATLPFKEITAEIGARMHPTTLDLGVAFFSGAICYIATSREVKGVMTSIPGVAIAVALMPPLGVVGYGIALALSSNGDEGLRIAFGGGLLFLTNLVAITFTAMIVFLALHIDVPSVKEKIDDWHRTDEHSIRFRGIFARLPGMPGARHIGTLPGRLLMIVILILVILIPLSRSFDQLRQELAQQQKENRIRAVVTRTWRAQFGKLPDGNNRSFLDQVTVVDRGGKLTLQLRVLTSKPLVAAEKDQFNRNLAAALGTPASRLDMQLIEVPTTAAALKPGLNEPPVPVHLSIQQIQSDLFERIDSALNGLYFPPPAQFVDYRLSTQASDGLELTLSYLGDRDIADDARALIVQDVRTRLDYPTASIQMVRLPSSLGSLFRARSSALDRADLELLDKAAGYLQQHGRLIIQIISNKPRDSSQEQVIQERLKTVRDHLATAGQIAADRIELKPQEDTTAWTVTVVMTSVEKE
jgi:uncharacterized hydrophobic protein (TIGR00271 family)